MKRILPVLILLLVVGCVSRTYQGEASGGAPRILMMGDSMLSWNRLRGHSVGRELARDLGQPVRDNSISSATYVTDEGSGGIAAQYTRGKWDWVVMNGGGNNLLFGCGCNACDETLDQLVTADGSAGAIPDAVARARRGGAQVIYAGYLRTPGFTSLVEHCGPVGDMFEQRLARMAARDPGVHFLLLADLVPEGDNSYHFVDGVHPSPKGSAAIAARIAAIIGK